MTTQISLIDEKYTPNENNLNENSEENISKNIIDLSLDLETRLNCIDIFYKKEGDNIIEIINKLIMMYELSNLKLLKQYLYDICEKSSLTPFLKSIVAKGLCFHDEKDELGYKAVNLIFPNMGDEIGTPYKIEFVKILMKNENYKDKANMYFCNIINDDKLDCEYRFRYILSLEERFLYFKNSAFIQFLNNRRNMTLFRILASQNLLRVSNTDGEIKKHVQENLLSFANDNELDYNLRADATDVLLQLGDEYYKELAQRIIMVLGNLGSNTKPKTIYQNAQNVHSKEIEDSIKQGLEYIQTFGIMKVEEKEIDMLYVEKKINDLLKLDTLKYINSDKVKIALTRISLDRALYSAFNCSLENILLRVWTYIIGHTHEEEMKKRLLEELVEMAGTCSTGFATRLINSISGFGEFTIKISWREQIVGNFTGRLNAKIKNMDDLTLQEKVLEEMMLETSNYSSRKKFLKFLRNNLLEIREELYDEFKTHISDTDFDLYFRTAVSMYETGNYV